MNGQPPSTQSRSLSPALGWLGCSLVVAVLYCLPPLHNAFSAAYVVQDDARQHVFWMQRYVDPSLFPNDFLADYFQSVAPWGYATVYRVGAELGLDPWVLNKILPVLIVSAATVFAFGVVMELVQLPVAAFVATVFLNQIFPLRDDVVSATPAAFFQPFFLAFLFFALRRSPWLCGLTIVLMGSFYPQGVLVMAGTLGLLGLTQIRWQKGRWRLVGTAADYWLVGVGAVAACGVLLPYALQDSPYGPVLTVAEARNMFALSSRGWSKFFDDDWADFWLFGKRTGLFPMEWATLDLKVQPQLWMILSVQFLLLLPGKSPLAKVAAPRVALLGLAAIASALCYALAHLLLFELHLPNRYTEHSLRAIAALAAGVAVALILDRWRSRPPAPQRRPLRLGLLGVWAIAPLLVGLIAGESRGNYIHGKFPELYDYLKTQPQSTVIASLDAEINNLPSFSNRSIFVGGQGFTLPYHSGFYATVRQRSLALIEAQYSFDPTVVRDFLAQNAIDLWLVTTAMFTPEWVRTDHWLLQYATETIAPQAAAAHEQPTV
ncbi:MAG TPA: hypothetical protein V6D02_00610, partial [Candidatus Obscuribacterales bacterium]